MNDPTRSLHPFGRSQEDDLNILANGGETGWWGDDGHPAPWPPDILDADAGWTNGTTDAPSDGDENNPGNRPF